MWAVAVMRPWVRSYWPRRVSTRCVAMGTFHRYLSTASPEFPQRNCTRGDYSAHNSWRA